LGAERKATDGQGFDEFVGVGASLPQPITAAKLAGSALFLCQGGDVSSVLDAQTAIVAALVLVRVEVDGRTDGSLRTT
jgi:hypothetical protein